MYTDEQQAIINSNARRLRVIAGPGTGKTSTLVGYAQARDESMLYLAYNKSIQLEASRKFPKNVRCLTTHALAFPTHGKPYAHKLGNLRIGDIAEILRISYPYAAMVNSTLNNFLSSVDEKITADHFPPDINRKNFIEVNTVLLGAKSLWKRMQDVDDKRVPMQHDGYLKLFVMSKPKLNYPKILFDESQDSNPLTTKLVLDHDGGLVCVGDGAQAIYQFRGARDALKEIADAETYTLTQSFRFGPPIARIANRILEYLGMDHRLTGAGQCQDTRMSIDTSQPYAYIARTNMAVIQAAIFTLTSRQRSFYVGGVENIRLSLIEDGYRLFRGDLNAIKDRFVKKFKSISALELYAQEAGDVEMNLLCNVTKTYSHDIPQIVQQIRDLSVDSIQDADRVFSTCHKAKGLEFPQVRLADDFPDLVERGQLIPLKDMDPQDVNLHFVAATRAMEALEVSPQLREFLEVVDNPRLIDRVHSLNRQPR